MPIKFKCGTCGVSMHAPDKAAGRLATCPKCGAKVHVPAAEEPLILNELALPSEPPPAPAPQVVVIAPRSRRDDEDEDYERPARRTRRGRERDTDVGFRCPYCNTDERPVRRKQITTAGWVTFWLMFVCLCWPLCWIGLLMKEEYTVCAGCGTKIA